MTGVVYVQDGHVFETDEEGCEVSHDMGGHCDGPHCVLCEEYWCRNCDDHIYKEACPERLHETLPGLEYPQPEPPPRVVGRRNANLPTISRLPR